MTTTTTSHEDDDRRRHVRKDVATVILVSPNGNENRTSVFDVSESGARIGLPKDFEYGVGAGVRLFFPMADKGNVAFGAKIVRVAIDHLGIEFGPGQEEAVHSLLETLAPR